MKRLEELGQGKKQWNAIDLTYLYIYVGVMVYLLQDLPSQPSILKNRRRHFVHLVSFPFCWNLLNFKKLGKSCSIHILPGGEQLLWFLYPGKTRFSYKNHRKQTNPSLLGPKGETPQWSGLSSSQRSGAHHGKLMRQTNTQPIDPHDLRDKMDRTS